MAMPDRRKKDSREGKKMFLMVLPFLILNFLFCYFPLHGWIYALYDYRSPLKLSQCEFVGLKWFKMLVANETQLKQIGQVMKNTFAMTLAGSVGNVGEFGWGGAAGSTALVDTEAGLAVFYVQHTLNPREEYYQPRLRNVVYSCLD